MILTKEKVLIIILLILNFVGIIGLSIPETQKYLLPFSPFNLLLSFLFILLVQAKNFSFYGCCLFIFFFGLFAEIVGVGTGLIFGEYVYGSSLGWKVKGVPPIIGVNWLLCILSVGSFLSFFKINKWLKIIIGSSLLVLLDFYIEPVAIKLDFWHWGSDDIPIQNYVAWWLISAVMLLVYYNCTFEKYNALAYCQFLIFIIFFGILNLTLF